MGVDEVNTALATGKVFVIYIPGMDLRNFSELDTPFLSDAFKSYSSATIETQPSPEQLSTLITGTNPGTHGIWQMKLLENAGALRRQKSLFEKLPDFFTTTWQCLRHQFCKDCDVPTMPPNRRKVFELHRLKFHGRKTTQDLLTQLGSAKSVVSHLGSERCKYTFTDKLHDFDWALENTGHGDSRLEFLQFHALDMMGHWVLDTPEKLRQVYRRADELVASFYEKCKQKKVTVFAMTDHGQEKVTAEIDLTANLAELDLDPAEYSYYLQPITARFWFHSARAHKRISAMLQTTAHGTLHTFADLQNFDIHFSNGDYGELYFLADPGYLYFPHDFHYRFVDLAFGLKSSQQRGRIYRPRHLAYQGYLPHHPSEKGWIVPLDDRLHFERDELKLADIAPSLLGALGELPAPFMDGTNRFCH